MKLKIKKLEEDVSEKNKQLQKASTTSNFYFKKAKELSDKYDKELKKNEELQIVSVRLQKEVLDANKSVLGKQ